MAPAALRTCRALLPAHAHARAALLVYHGSTTAALPPRAAHAFCRAVAVYYRTLPYHRRCRAPPPRARLHAPLPFMARALLRCPAACTRTAPAFGSRCLLHTTLPAVWFGSRSAFGSRSSRYTPLPTDYLLPSLAFCLPAFYAAFYIFAPSTTTTSHLYAPYRLCRIPTFATTTLPAVAFTLRSS